MKARPRKSSTAGTLSPPPGFDSPKRPLLDRIVLTLALPAKLARALAGALQFVLRMLNYPDAAAFPLRHRCSRNGSAPQSALLEDEDYEDEDDLKAAGLLGSDDEQAASPISPTVHPPGRVSRSCPRCGREVRIWELRQPVPNLPGFPQHCTVSIRFLVRWYDSGPGVVNTYMHLDCNLTRLLQVHGSSRVRNLELWFRRPSAQRTNYVLLHEDQAGEFQTLRRLISVQGELIHEVLDLARAVYTPLLQDAWDIADLRSISPKLREEFCGDADEPPEPTARLKKIEVYSDSISTDAAEELEGTREDVRYALIHVDEYRDGRPGCHGELRRGRREKAYEKDELLDGRSVVRRETVSSAAVLRSLFGEAPVLVPGNGTGTTKVVDALVREHIRFWNEIDRNRGLSRWRASSEDLDLVLDTLGYRFKTRKLAKLIIRAHWLEPVDRAALVDLVADFHRRMSRSDKKVLRSLKWVREDFLPALEEMGIYRRACKRNGPGRMVKSSLRRAIRRARRARRCR